MTTNNALLSSAYNDMEFTW